MHPVLKSQSDSDTALLKESGYNPTNLKVFKAHLEFYSKNPSTNPSVNSIQSIRFQNVTIRKKKNPKSFSVDPSLMSYKPLSVSLEEAISERDVIVPGSTGELRALNPQINVFQ